MKKEKVHKLIILFAIILTLISVFAFFGIMSGGSFGPLFRKANQLDFEFLVIRRITSLLSWMAFAFFSMYIAATEISPFIHTGETNFFRKYIHPAIIINYVISVVYALFQLTVIFYENEMHMKIMRLLYLTDLGIIMLGFIMYLMLVYWIPKVKSSEKSCSRVKGSRS